MVNGRCVLAVLFMLSVASASAGWDTVYVTKTAVHYVDPESIRKEGDFRKVLTLQDLKVQGKRGEHSMRALMEYDCKNKRVRPISATAHRGQMATGEILVTISTPSKWISIAPESAFNTTLRHVCAQ
jgi:hypothetical protein